MGAHGLYIGAFFSHFEKAELPHGAEYQILLQCKQSCRVVIYLSEGPSLFESSPPPNATHSHTQVVKEQDAPVCHMLCVTRRARP